MPRTARTVAAGVCYHIINRSNNRARIFHSDADYRYFLIAMQKAQQNLVLEVFSACLMPNHIHFVARPRADLDLARWMQRLMTTHVRWHHQRYRTTGRLWQGRYKVFPIEQDAHLITVLRYVERNALRARLVDRAEHWPWGSLAWRANAKLRNLIAEPPVGLPADWIQYVNAPQSAAELDAVRVCVNRQRPFGNPVWVEHAAKRFNLTASLTPRGRPRKNRDQALELLDYSIDAWPVR